MRMVLKRYVIFLLDRSLDCVNRNSAAEDIVLRYENDVIIRKLVPIIAGQDQVCVHQRTVVSGAFRSSSAIVPLHFDVIMLVATVNRINIQSYRTPLKIFYAVL